MGGLYWGQVDGLRETLESLSADSWGTLEFRDGSIVTISGRSVLTISERERKELHLRHGRLSVSVARQPADRPMFIYTRTAELEVVGTQFNLDAESSRTSLAVNDARKKRTPGNARHRQT
jgi:ferric-dicitrate binding protein FerR (iron transport regulator)